MFVEGHQKQVGPDLFRVFYTIWKDTEAEAQEVCICSLFITYCNNPLYIFPVVINKYVQDMYLEFI